MREIPSVPGYFVDEYGVVYSGLKPGPALMMEQIATQSGYLRVSLCRKSQKRRSFFVHRLVLETYVGPCPPGHQTRHLDGNGKNNRVENLAWGSRAENLADMRRHGSTPRGEANKKAKLSRADIAAAYARVQAGESQASVARFFGVARCTINHILRGRTWKHLNAAVSP